MCQRKGESKVLSVAFTVPYSCRSAPYLLEKLTTSAQALQSARLVPSRRKAAFLGNGIAANRASRTQFSTRTGKSY